MLLLALFLCACDDKNEIGLPIDTAGTIDALTIDLPVNASMVLIDSISTKNRSRVLVGSYEDDDFGTVSAKAFSQLALSSLPSDTKIPDAATFRNAVLWIGVDYKYGVEEVSQHAISIHRLDEVIDTDVDHFFNDQTSYLMESLGDSIITFDQARKDTVAVVRHEMNLSDQFGQDLLATLKAIETGSGADSTISLSQATFNTAMNGLAIVQEGISGNVLGITLNPLETKISLIYDTEAADSVVFDLFFSQVGLELEAKVDSYSNISVDRAGTGLSGLVESYTDYASVDGNIYSQFAAGVVPKLGLSAFDDFLETIDGKLLIVKAELLIEETQNVENTLPPASLYFPITNGSNLLMDPDSTTSIVASSTVPVYPRAVQDEFFYTSYYQRGLTFLDPLSATANHTVQLFDDNNYDLLLGLYLQLIVDGIIENDDLLVYSNFFNQAQTLERFVVAEDNIKLKLYYTILK